MYVYICFIQFNTILFMFNKDIINLINKPCVVFKSESFLENNFYDQIRENFPKYDQVLKLYPNKNFRDNISFSSKSEYYSLLTKNEHLQKLNDIVMSKSFFKHFYKFFFFEFCKARNLNPIQLIRLIRPACHNTNNNSFYNKFFNSVSVTIQYSYMPNNNGLTPHTDSHSKLLSLMLYFPDKDYADQGNYGTQFWNSDIKSIVTNHQYGDLERKFKKDSTKNIKTQFEENTLYGFIRNNRSWHTVEPLNIDDSYIRKSININFTF